MTGFALQEGAGDGARWRWEIRSVNGRGLDVRLRLPPGFERLDGEFRRRIAAAVSRGNVSATLSVERDASQLSVSVNRAVLDVYYEAARALRERDDRVSISADGLLSLRGVVEAADEVSGADEALGEAVADGLDAALGSLRDNRRAEGERIGVALAALVDRIEALAGEAEANPSRTPEAISRRIAAQVAQLTDASPALDPDRLHQEAVLAAARADIREELDRLQAHVAAARDLLKTSGPVGRKLDFLTQEFNRETNTLCSKSNDTSLTRTGLEMKAVVDQLREQVQNIE
ncbi:MAG: YicC/YloC family endoribonuclease [Flavobacteriaceae bacterium]